MKCPQCQTDNPENRKYCRDCGEKLLLLCPLCEFQNVPGDKFCGECGHNLAPGRICPAPILKSVNAY